MRIYPSNKLCNLASEVWKLWENGSANAGGGAGVEDEGMPAIGAKKEGTSTALSLVFLAPRKLIVWSFTFQQFLVI